MPAKRNEPHVGHVYRSKNYRETSPSNEIYETASPFEETSEKPKMYLGEVLYWVASKGKTHPVSDYIEDWPKVRAKIVAGELPVEGKNTRTNQFEPILDSNFSAAVIGEANSSEFLFSPVDECHGSVGGTLYPPGETDPLWIQIQCMKAKVQKAWPEFRPSRRVKTYKVRKEATRKLIKMIKDSPDRPPKPKGEIIKDLQNEIPGLTTHAATVAWDEAKSKVRPNSWGRPGAPKKS